MTSSTLLVCVPGTLCNGRAFAPLIRELVGRGLSIRQLLVDTATVTSVRSAAEAGLARLDPPQGRIS